MNKIIKAAAVASLALSSASAFAWVNGPFDGFTNGFGDFADQFFGDGLGDADGTFDMNMSSSTNTHGWGRGYDRFQGYNAYGYAPYPFYGYPYAAPVAPVAMTAPQAPVVPQAPVAVQAPAAR